MLASSPASDSVRRLTIAGVLFIFCCLLSTVRVVTNTPRRLSKDDIAKRSDLRFAALKAELPKRGVVGYVGGTGDSSVADYYLAQYALAPLVVDESPNHTLVVGNFPASQAKATFFDLQLVREFGDGVILFANPALPNSNSGDAVFPTKGAQ